MDSQGSILFARPGEDPNEGLKAFYVKEGDAFIMYPSTWHGLITPLGCDSVDLLVMFEKDTEDLDIDVEELREEVINNGTL